MYGYVVPVKENMNQADFVLYRAFYCGICKATGKMYGQFPRFTTNYDIVFLSVLLHDISSQEVEFAKGGCICNPFKKKATVARNDLLDKVVSANIILSYYKVSDDIIDGDGVKKKLVRKVLNRAYKRAKNHMPKVDEIINSSYKALNALEKAETVGIDRVSHCFASLLMDVAKEILGSKTDDNLLKLCYNVGKFVYIADALDDIDEDAKKKRYNPFLLEFKNYKSRQQFLNDNRAELEFICAAAVNRAIECFNNLSFSQSSSLLANIIHYGLRDKVNQIFRSTKKLEKPRI